MIDISRAKSELSLSIQNVVDWLDKNGFDAELIKYNINKTIFEVQKSGTKDILEITNSKEKGDLSKYLESFLKSFDMKCEIKRMKKEVEERSG